MADIRSQLAAALADRYLLERELGQGGMATVYLAQDLKHNRQVAIKVLREDLAASMGAARFLREIQIAAQLQHPHILPLLDSGEASGFLYYVMPYVKGQSLRERLAREGELPITEAVHLLTEVVDALAAAHEHGVVHRDIKPDNVMLSGRHALVTDFGVAKAISDAAGRNTITTLGVAVGTPAYMSPEQAAADAHIDHRSDIYSVGVMAYEMLTGSPPFTGNTAQQVLAAQVTQEPDPISRRRASIPPALGQIVMRCLAKRPADRWQSASELLGQLELLATPSGGVTHATPRAIASNPASGRRGLLLGISALVGIGMLAAILIMHRPRAATPPVVPTQLTYTGRVERVSLSPDGGYIAYTEHRECAQGIDCALNKVIQETSTNGIRTTVDSGISGFPSSGWSPDGRRYLLSKRENAHFSISVRSVVGGEIVNTLGGNAVWSASPDTLLVWDWTPSRDSAIWVRTVNATTGMASDSFRFGPAAGIWEVRPSPDKRFLLVTYSTAAYTSVVIVTRRGVVVDTVSQFDGALGWGPHSDRVYMRRDLENRTQVMRQDLDRSGRRTGSPKDVVSLEGGNLSLAGDMIVYVGRGAPQQELWTVEWKTGAAHAPVKTRIYQTTAGGWANPSRDGSHVFVVEWQEAGDSSVARMQAVPFAGGASVAFAGSRWINAMSQDLSADETHGVVAERRDGRTVLTLITNLRTGAGAELKTTFADSGTVWMLPGSRVLWQPNTRHEFVILDEHGEVLRQFAWPDSLGLPSAKPSADGSALALLAWKLGGDSSSTSLYRMSLADGKISLLARPLGPDAVGLDWAGPWSADGWLPLIRQGKSGPAMLIRVAPAGERRCRWGSPGSRRRVVVLVRRGSQARCRICDTPPQRRVPDSSLRPGESLSGVRDSRFGCANQSLRGSSDHRPGRPLPPRA